MGWDEGRKREQEKRKRKRARAYFDIPPLEQSFQMSIHLLPNPAIHIPMHSRIRRHHRLPLPLPLPLPRNSIRHNRHQRPTPCQQIVRGLLSGRGRYGVVHDGRRRREEGREVRDGLGPVVGVRCAQGEEVGVVVWGGGGDNGVEA